MNSSARAEDRRRLDVVGHQVEGQHPIGGDVGEALRAQLGREQIAQLGRVLEADHGRQVLLRVELQTLVLDLAAEVDGEVRDPQQRTREVDQHALQTGSDLQADPARQREVAIQPGVQQHAAVGLDPDLSVAVGAQIRPRLDAQIRRIGVGAEDAEAALGRRRRAHLEGHQAAVAPHDEAAIARAVVPDLRLEKTRVAAASSRRTHSATAW